MAQKGQLEIGNPRWRSIFVPGKVAAAPKTLYPSQGLVQIEAFSVAIHSLVTIIVVFILLHSFLRMHWSFCYFQQALLGQ